MNGAVDNMSDRLQSIGLTLDSVVKVDVMLRDPWNLPILEEVFQKRFKGKYPARKTIETEFAHRGGPDGLEVQIDAIAYRE